MDNHKTGFVAILGLPNAGKSTLLNSLLGQKLSIITSKPQTTRRRILGILSEENFQVIFLDTPGIISPSYLLQEKMMDDIKTSIDDADVVIFIVDVKDDSTAEKLLEQEFVKKVVSDSKKSKLLILNKIDSITQEEIKGLILNFEDKKVFDEVIPVSAKLSFNTERVIEDLLKYIPEGPKLYPGDQLTDANERFFVSEIIREKILEFYRDEVPYSCEVKIAEFKERDKRKDFINAEIVVEKDSQKAIIIGESGISIKKLGQAARKSIEEFLQREVFIELRVKVRKKWRSDENLLKSFGYIKKE
ncbi:MAG: GTPase Era [Ignavibacteriaceae bacterium]|nr:GTPase Era [Ignavibacteria bacterium]MBT8391812.1 GTPase Era [Ignavibacteria bacterium]NNJ51873.1 GTPase Era [Ignavibacteriaceae bacterium]NNL21918.1 GTPase Era [Ignavibacteriaceae bacterium]